MYPEAPRRLTRVLACVAALGLAVLLLAAQAAALQLQATPDKLSLAPGESAYLLVQAQNPAEEEARQLALTWLAPAGVSVGIATSPVSGTLPQGSGVAWNLVVTRSGEIPPESRLLFRLDYQSGPPEKALPRVATSSVTLSARPPIPADQLAKIALYTSLDSLWEQRNGLVYVSVANQTDAALRLGALQASGPQFATFEVQPASAQALPPLGSAIYTVTVRVAERVQPGKHRLLFQVPVRREAGGPPGEYTLVASHEVQVGVLGESAILTLLAVPAFLFLPGFIAVVFAGLFWRLTRPKDAQGDFPLQPKSEAFWVAAIGLSLLIALFYPWLTGLFGQPRDLLVAYGFQDVIYAWLLGFGVGFLLVFALPWLARWLRDSFYPTQQDSPLATLVKLLRRGQGFYLPKVRLKDQPGEYFLLTAWREGQSQCWVCPPISLSSSEKIPAEREAAINQQLTSAGELSILLPLLQEAWHRGEIRLAWQSGAGPQRVSAAQVIEHCGKGLLVDRRT